MFSSIDLIRAISWTLVHSIWQAMVLCIAAAAVIFFTRTGQSAMRYRLLCGLLVVFIGAVVFTFLDGITTTTESIRINGAIVLESQSIDSPGILTMVSNWCNTNSQSIVMVWAFIMLIKSVFLIKAFVQLNSLRNKNTFAAPAALVEVFEQVKMQLKISANIIFKQSREVTQPSVIGFIKPMLLLPVSIVNNLPLQQVEAILLHELAHIKRRDYLTNLIQIFLETVFFFNPGVLWLSGLIRNEREQCCDDIAIKHTGDPLEYIKALMAAGNQSAASTYAIAFAGTRRSLYHRIKRIINKKQTKFSVMERSFIILCIAMISILIISFVPKNTQTTIPTLTAESYYYFVEPIAFEKVQPAAKPKVSKPTPIISSKDTIPPNASKEFIDGYKAGKNYTIHMQNKTPLEFKLELKKSEMQHKFDVKQQIDLKYQIELQHKIDLQHKFDLKLNFKNESDQQKDETTKLNFKKDIEQKLIDQLRKKKLQ